MTTIARALTHQTRSLWVVAGNGTGRIDLPPVELDDFRHEAEEPTASAVPHDPTCSWTARHLLPGFTFWVTRKYDHDPRPESGVRLGFGAGSSGYIHQVRTIDGGSEISLVFPHESNQESKSRYSFTLINPDGSRSRTMSILRHGDTFVGGVATVAPPQPAPVDEPVTVPRVALHSVAEALTLTDHAHLVPHFVELHTGHAIEPRRVDHHSLVISQSLAGGSVAFRGQVLLLALNPAPRVTPANESQVSTIQPEHVEPNESLLPDQSQVASGTTGKAIAGVGTAGTASVGTGQAGSISTWAETGHQAPGITTAGTLNLPQGAPLVVEVSSPSKIRMPALKGMTRHQAVPLLEDLGLVVVADGKMFADDIVMNSEPPGHTWVTPNRGVKLAVERKVPKVVGLSLQEARCA